MSTNRNDHLIAEYMRARARVEVPPDLLVSVRDGIASAPQAHRSWFAALPPVGVTALGAALVVALVVLIGLRPNLVGPSGSPSPAPSVAMDQKPVLRGLVQEIDDTLTSVTFYLGRLNGRTLYEETISGDQLGEGGWLGPFGESFLRVGIDGNQWTLDRLTLADASPRRIHVDDAHLTAVTASSDGAWVYLSRADTGGEDLGIWRLPADGGELVQVLQPDVQRPTPPRLSATVFFWTPDETRLLVQHCRGERVPGDDCTWTAIDGASGEVLREITPSAPAGIMVGIANDRLLAGADCDGISCDASLVDFATGDVTDVDVLGGRETLIESSAGPILLTDGSTPADGYVVTATELTSGRTWTAYTTFAPVLLVTLERGAGGVELDPGWFAVASEGQLGPVQLTAPVLVHALDGETFEMGNLVAQPSAEAPTPTPAPGYVQVDGHPITVLDNADADALFTDVETCVSAAGYAVELPASWYTNAATGDTPACSWFAPEPFDGSIRPVAVNPPPPDGVWITMRVIDGNAGYVGETPIYMNEQLRIGVFDAHRAEFGPSMGGVVGSPSPDRTYWYLVPFAESGPTFIAETSNDLANDYPLAKAVLDRIMASTSFQASGTAYTIVCRDVPEDLCHAYAEGAVAGPQPSGAAEVIEVTVTCEVNAPCAADRLDSGGQVIIRYADGATWSQDWSPGAGVSSG
jgi:hypothetical protein